MSVLVHNCAGRDLPGARYAKAVILLQSTSRALCAVLRLFRAASGASPHLQLYMKPARASYQYSLDRSTRAYVSRSSITTLQLKHTKHSGWYLCSPATWTPKHRQADPLVPSTGQRGKIPTGGCRSPLLCFTQSHAPLSPPTVLQPRHLLFILP